MEGPVVENTSFFRCCGFADQPCAQRAGDEDRESSLPPSARHAIGGPTQRVTKRPAR